MSQTAAEAALIVATRTTRPPRHRRRARRRSRRRRIGSKLRAFCQARAGKPAAQLSASLADQQGPDPTFDRLIAVIIAGAGDPGPAALDDGLDYAMSQQLKLDLSAALDGAAPAITAHLASASAAPAAATTPLEADLIAGLRKAKSAGGFQAAARLSLPAIVQLVTTKAPLQNPVQLAAAALAAGDLATAKAIRASLTGDAIPGADATDLAILDAAIGAASAAADGPTLDRLVERGAGPDPKAAVRAQAAAAFVLALGWPADSPSRAAFIDFPLGPGAAAPARLLLLDAAADAGVRGDAALLALSAAEPGGADGPGAADPRPVDPRPRPRRPAGRRPGLRHRGAAGPGKPLMGAEGWVEAFLEMMAVERAAARNTLTAYGKDLADAQGFLSSRKRDLASAAPEDIEAYFERMGALGLAPATAARRRAAVRGLYRFARARRGAGAVGRSVATGRRAEKGPAVAACAQPPGDGPADRGGHRQGRRGGPAPRLHGRAALRLGPAHLRAPVPARRRRGARPGLSDRQGQGRQGAPGPAERSGPGRR